MGVWAGARGAGKRLSAGTAWGLHGQGSIACGAWAVVEAACMGRRGEQKGMLSDKTSMGD